MEDDRSEPGAESQEDSGAPAPPPDSGTPTPPGSVPFWRTRRAARGAGILAVAIVLVGVVVAVASREPEPVRVVRDFLAAAQERDPQRALQIAGVDQPPTREVGRFLHPDAMDGEWEIRSVEETYHYEDEARVKAVIAGPDGGTAETTMDLTRDGDAWVIEAPLAYVSFLPGPLRYLEVNGVRAPLPERASEQDYSLHREYALLPGRYQFYTDLPDSVEVRFVDRQTWPAGTVGHELVLPPRKVHLALEAATITAAGEQAVQVAVEAYIDTCAQSTSPAPPGCPFGTDPSTGPRLPEHGYLDDIEDIQWSVIEYPTVAAIATVDGVAITDRRRGVVQLRAAGHDIDYSGDEPTDLGTVEFTVECEMITSDLVASFAADGAVWVSTVSEREWDTCDHWPLTPLTG